MYTKAQIEVGEGRYVEGRTVIIQNGSQDEFDTQPAAFGWIVNPHSEWHISGGATPNGKVEWVDLR